MTRFASQTFARPTIRVNICQLVVSSYPWHPFGWSSFLTNGSIFEVFFHVMRRVFVNACHLPFSIVAIHLGSFVHVPSRLQLCGATTGVCWPARRWAGYVSNFEMRYLSRYAAFWGVLDSEGRGGGSVGSLNWGYLPFAKETTRTTSTFVRFRRFAPPAARVWFDRGMPRRFMISWGYGKGKNGKENEGCGNISCVAHVLLRATSQTIDGASFTITSIIRRKDVERNAQKVTFLEDQKEDSRRCWHRRYFLDL